MKDVFCYRVFSSRQKGGVEDISLRGELFSWNCGASKDISFCGELLSWKRMFFQDECFILRGICGFFPPGLLLRVIPRGFWGYFQLGLLLLVILRGIWSIFPLGLLLRVVPRGFWGIFPPAAEEMSPSALKKYPVLKRNTPACPKERAKKIAASFLKLR